MAVTCDCFLRSRGDKCQNTTFRSLPFCTHFILLHLAIDARERKKKHNKIIFNCNSILAFGFFISFYGSVYHSIWRQLDLKIQKEKKVLRMIFVTLLVVFGAWPFE